VRSRVILAVPPLRSDGIPRRRLLSSYKQVNASDVATATSRYAYLPAILIIDVAACGGCAVGGDLGRTWVYSREREDRLGQIPLFGDEGVDGLPELINCAVR
jgi:hypothetical protein